MNCSIYSISSVNGAQYRIPCVGYIFPMSHKRIGTLKMKNSFDIFNSDIIAIKDCICPI